MDFSYFGAFEFSTQSFALAHSILFGAFTVMFRQVDDFCIFSFFHELLNTHFRFSSVENSDRNLLIAKINF